MEICGITIKIMDENCQEHCLWNKNQKQAIIVEHSTIMLLSNTRTTNTQEKLCTIDKICAATRVICFKSGHPIRLYIHTSISKLLHCVD